MMKGSKNQVRTWREIVGKKEIKMEETREKNIYLEGKGFSLRLVCSVAGDSFVLFAGLNG